MNEKDAQVQQFEAYRGHMRAVAYRMLGSMGEAEDAVQEAWLRLNRSDADSVSNLGGWLTTVVARVCLDMLRSRKLRREDSLDPAELCDAPLADKAAPRPDGIGPEGDALLADAIGPALLVVLETLAPAERLAFVLHDMFDVPFEEIAPIVGRSEAAARQLASRARRRVRGAPTDPDADSARQREIVGAFLAASRDGDFDALLSVLDPDVVVRADSVAVKAGASALLRGASSIRGAEAVAQTFKGRARGTQLAIIDGVPGAVWSPTGKMRAAIAVAFEGDRIASIDLIADPASLAALDIKILDD